MGDEVSAFWQGKHNIPDRPDVPNFCTAILCDDLVDGASVKSSYKLTTQDVERLYWCTDPSHGFGTRNIPSQSKLDLQGVDRTIYSLYSTFAMWNV